MIGMRVRFEQPVNSKLLLPDIGDDRVCRGEGGATRRWIIVQDAVDNRSASALGIVDDIADRVGRLVEKGLDDDAIRRRNANLHRCLLNCRVGHGEALKNHIYRNYVIL